MQMFRRMLAVLTAALMLISFASCGRQGASSDAAKSSLGYQKLVLYMPSNGQQKDNHRVEAEINRHLAEKLNVEISLGWTDFTTYGTRLPLRLQAGEQLDLIWLNAGNYMSNVSRNNLMELTSLLGKHGQGITDSMPEMLMEGAKINDKLYAIPVNKEYGTNFALYVRKDLIDKYGIDLSASDAYETFEQNVLKVIKENEPSLAPLYRARGSIPFQLKDTPGESMEERLRFEAVGGLEMVVIDTLSGKAICVYESEKKLNELKAYERWNNLGYFNEDAPVVSIDDQTAIRSGAAWTTVTSGKPGVEGDLSALLGTEMVKGPQSPLLLDANGLWGSMNAIPVSSADPARAMMVLNLLHTDEALINLFVNGIEDVHYVKAGESRDGKPIIKLPEGVGSRNDSPYYPSTDWIIGNLFNNYLWNTDDEQRFEEFKVHSQNAIKPKTFGFVYNPTEVNNQITVLNNIVAEYNYLLNVGALDTDTAIPELLERLYANGLSEVLEDVQKQYDAYMRLQ